MSRNLKQFLILLAQSIVFWIIAFSIFIFIRYYALNQEQGLSLKPDFDIPITEWLDIGAILGLIIGFFYAIGEFVYDKVLSKKLNLGVSVLLKSFAYILLLIFSVSIMSFFIEFRMDIDLPNEKGWWRTNPIFWLIVGYFWLCTILFSVFKIASEHFGKGVFFEILLGRYRNPREVKRIFMFIDLRSSTSIAEQLGHFKYSQFIQDCFYDLNVALEKYDAEIYQYVGDEAVISWNYTKGVKNNKCINLYFDFKNRLLERKEFYEEKYGQIPEFKVGIHGGKLMLTEVGAGSIKKELAYHGDVINTTARIQSECNVYNEYLLISEDLLNDLKLTTAFNTKLLGSILLKGKRDEVNIHSIQASRN